MENQEIQAPEGYEILSGNEHIVRHIEKGSVHLYFDGKVSKARLSEYRLINDTDSGELSENAATVLRRSLRSDYKSDVVTDSASFLVSKYHSLKVQGDLIDKGYVSERATELSKRDIFETLPNGLVIGYIPVSLVNQKFGLDKKGNRTSIPAFPTETQVGQWDGKVTEKVTYPNTAEEYRFNIVDVHSCIHQFGLDWLVGYGPDYKEQEGEFVIQSEAWLFENDVDEYVKVIFDPAHVLGLEYTFSVSLRGAIVTKFMPLEFVSKDKKVRVANPTTIEEYLERCDEDWNEYKEKVIKTVTADAAEVIDFDIN